jgi:hypothetical protein
MPPTPPITSRPGARIDNPAVSNGWKWTGGASTVLSQQRGSIMSELNSLASRIDAEFAAIEEKTKKVHVERMEEQRERQKRLEQLGRVFDELRTIWKPRQTLGPAATAAGAAPGPCAYSDPPGRG